MNMKNMNLIFSQKKKIWIGIGAGILTLVCIFVTVFFLFKSSRPHTSKMKFTKRTNPSFNLTPSLNLNLKVPQNTKQNPKPKISNTNKIRIIEAKNKTKKNKDDKNMKNRLSLSIPLTSTPKTFKSEQKTENMNNKKQPQLQKNAHLQISQPKKSKKEFEFLEKTSQKEQKEKSYYVPARDILTGKTQKAENLDEKIAEYQKRITLKKMEIELKRLEQQERLIPLQTKAQMLQIAKGIAQKTEKPVKIAETEKYVPPPAVISIQEVNGQYMAIIKPSSGSVVRVKSGSYIEGYLVKQITHNTVIFQDKQGRKVEIGMELPDKYPVTPTLFANSKVAPLPPVSAQPADNSSLNPNSIFLQAPSSSIPSSMTVPPRQ